MPRLLDAMLNRLAVRIAPLIAARLAATFGDAIQNHVDQNLLPQLHDKLLHEAERRADAIVNGRIAETATAANILREEMFARPLVGSELYLPTNIVTTAQPGDYMSASVPMTRDFLHPKYAEFARSYGLPFVLHRKHWEWAFICQRLEALGMLAPGKRGLGFGVGREWLPALFARAGVAITATDSPSDEMNWGDSGQYGGAKETLFAPHLISRESFEERVAFEPCDMTQLPQHLSGYDFCWSSCCFEHLGNLQRGLDFVIESVERCLAVGGVACHTTEFNLSSDEETIEAGRDVIYRRQDLIRLCDMLEKRGHHVEPLRIEAGTLPPDYLVDVPPYRVNPHLKLRIGKFVATSIGLVIRRGR